MPKKPLNPAPFQPLNVFFNLKLGGLDRIYDGPNIPIDFTFDQVGGAATSTVEINLLDEAGWEVEPYIWEARNAKGYAQGSFSFGYKGSLNVDSGDIPFHIISYTPVYKRNTFCINIHGDLAMPAHVSSNQYHGTVKEVIDAFMKDHDWIDGGVEYSDEFDVDKMQSLGRTDHETTSKREMQIHKIQGESDWVGLARACQLGMDGQGRAGYYPYICVRDGKTILQIIKPSDGGGADYEYTVQTKESVVVEWNPHINLSPVRGGEEHFNGRSPSTGYTTKNAMDQENTKDIQGGNMGYDVTQQIKSTPEHESATEIFNRCAENMQDNVVNGAIRHRMAHTGDPFGFVNALKAQFNIGGLNNMPADLVVLGDPEALFDGLKLRVMQVNFYYPINYLNNSIRKEHYTSGKYWIDGITHEIRLGSYLTTYKLRRTVVGQKAPATESQGNA